MEADLEENINWRYQHFTTSQKKAYNQRKKELVNNFFKKFLTLIEIHGYQGTSFPHKEEGTTILCY